MSAADGISTIAPISSFSSNGIFSARSSALHFSTSALAWFSSSRPEIIGYIIFTLPSALARRMARNWVRNSSGCARQKRIARQPRNGFISCASCRCEANLSPPKSSVRMMTGLRLQRGGNLAINFILFFLVRQAVAADEQKFRAEQSDAFRAVRDNCLDVVLVFNIRREMN